MPLSFTLSFALITGLVSEDPSPLRIERGDFVFCFYLFISTVTLFNSIFTVKKHYKSQFLY